MPMLMPVPVPVPVNVPVLVPVPVPVIVIVPKLCLPALSGKGVPTCEETLEAPSCNNKAHWKPLPRLPLTTTQRS